MRLSITRWGLARFAAVAALAALAGAGLWVASGAGNDPSRSGIGTGRTAGPAFQEAEEDGALGRGALRNAQAIADHFGVGQQEVIDLHGRGAGFGALVKIYAIAGIRGVSAASLVGQLPLDAEGDVDLDALMASLTESERAAFDELGLRGMGHLKNKSATCPPGLEKQGRC